MADSKLSALAALTGATVAVGDLFYVDDVSVTTSKSITAAEMRIAVGPQLGTVNTTTGGTAVGFTGIPAGVKKLSFMLGGLSWNATAEPIIQIGDAGGYEDTGYASIAGYFLNGGAVITRTSSTGITLGSGWADGTLLCGKVDLALIDPATFLWTWTLSIYDRNLAYIIIGSGVKNLSAELNSIQVTTAAGTATVDVNDGTNISYE